MGALTKSSIKAPSSLIDFKRKFDPVLENFLSEKIKLWEKVSPEFAKVLESVGETFSGGGKRIRPAFMFYAYQACGGQDNRAIINASCSIEFLHQFALIHDDIMDNAFLRRGKPALQQTFGLSTAILLGDLLQTFGWEILSGSDFSPSILRDTQKIFAQLSQEAIVGQYLDISIASRLKKINFGKLEQSVLRVLELKSGRYTVEKPCYLGASLAKAKAGAFKVFSNYGIPLGIAFQLQDDILGMYGQEAELGKPADSDLKEGKLSLLVVKTLQKLNQQKEAEIKKKFLSLWGNKKITQNDLGWVRNIIEITGALRYSKDLAEKLVCQAKESLAHYPFEKSSRDFFMETADFLRERNF